MPHRKWGFMCAIGLVFAPWEGNAAVMHWPDLPKECFVSARPATVADLKKGCAAFMMGDTGISAGTPLNIEIPQYAWHVDRKSGERTPVILIQAEEGSGIKAVGYKELDSPSLGVTLLSEMILLGNNKPFHKAVSVLWRYLAGMRNNVSRPSHANHDTPFTVPR